MNNRCKIWLAAGALMAGGAFTSSSAEAITLSTPTSINAAIQHANPIQDAAYFCRPVWRCGYWGCGWRRACWWGPGPYAYGYGYGYRYRWGWRHHHHYW